MSDVTRILNAIDRGDSQAAADLLPLVYDELRKLAAQRLAEEKPGQTLQSTALVHEAYVRLVVESDKAPAEWNSRGHFFAAAAEAMRRILVEAARRKATEKRGGDLRKLSLDAVVSLAAADVPPREDLLALDDALSRLEAEDPIKAKLVKLRYFAGLSVNDAAAAIGVSPATAKRYWAYAKAWLYGQLHGE